MTSLPITIDIANHPVELKVTSNHAGMIGTLVINEGGLGFKPPCAKKDVEAFVPWNNLTDLIALHQRIKER